MSSERDKQVATYVTEETKEQLKREADQEDVPLSKYLRQLIEQARLEDTQEQYARELNAEERLLEIVTEGKDEMAEMADQVEQQNRLVGDLLARFGAYPIVNFQLLKAAHSPSEPTINDWFGEASTRLRAADSEAVLSDTALSVDSADGDEGESSNQNQDRGHDSDRRSRVDQLR